METGRVENISQPNWAFLEEKPQVQWETSLLAGGQKKKIGNGLFPLKSLALQFQALGQWLLKLYLPGG